MNKKCLFILPLFFLSTACATMDFIVGYGGSAIRTGVSALVSKSGIDQTQSGKDYEAQANNTNKHLEDEIAKLEQEKKENPEKAAYYDEEIRRRNSQKQETKMSAAIFNILGISEDEQELGRQLSSGDKYDRRNVIIKTSLKTVAQVQSKSELGSKNEEIWNAIGIALTSSEVKISCDKEINKSKTPQEKKQALDNCRKKLAASIKDIAQKEQERSARLAQIEKAKIEEMNAEAENRLKMSPQEAQQYANASEEEIAAWIKQTWTDEDFTKEIEEDVKIYDIVAQHLIDAEERRKADEEKRNREIAEEVNENENEEVEEVEETDVESNEQIYETESKNYRTNGRQNAIEAINQTQVNSYRINSFELTQEQKNSLDDVAKLLSDNEDLSITIIGHTCSMGSSYVNKLVGKKRAESAKKYLVKKGVSANRISVSTKGKNEPIDSNDTLEGRQANRRIEFRVD